MFKPRLRLSCGLHALVSAWNSSGYCGFLPYFKNMQGQLTKSLTVLNVCELLFFYNCTVYRAPPSKVSCARISSLVLNKHDRIFLDVRYLPRNKENHDKQIMSVIHPLHLRVVGIPADFSREVGYTRNWTPASHRAQLDKQKFTFPTMDNLKSTINLCVHVFGMW